MPMTREDHENLLNELNNTELDHVRRTEVLQLLRTDYGAVITDDTTKTESIEALQKDNSDLVVANSKLFRQMGTQQDPDLQKKEEAKTRSETITLESLNA